MFASVTLEGTNYGVSSNVDGYYSLSRIRQANTLGGLQFGV